MSGKLIQITHIEVREIRNRPPLSFGQKIWIKVRWLDSFCRVVFNFVAGNWTKETFRMKFDRDRENESERAWHFFGSAFHFSARPGERALVRELKWVKYVRKSNWLMGLPEISRKLTIDPRNWLAEMTAQSMNNRAKSPLCIRRFCEWQAVVGQARGMFGSVFCHSFPRFLTPGARFTSSLGKRPSSCASKLMVPMARGGGFGVGEDDSFAP